MKQVILLFFLVIVVIFLTGCTGKGEPPVSDQVQPINTPVGTSTGITAAKTTRQPITTVQTTTTASTGTIFHGNYTWVEYRENSSVTLPPNPRSSWIYYHRLERLNVSYRARPAILERVTTISDYPECCINNVATITKNGSVYIADTYSDPVTDRILGRTLSNTIKGVAQPSKEYPTDGSDSRRPDVVDPHEDNWMGFSPFREPDIPFTEAGTEPITVPAGTYPEVRRYTATFSDGTPITFWVAPGVPVPVRYEFPNRYLDGIDPFQSFELVGWE